MKRLVMAVDSWLFAPATTNKWKDTANSMHQANTKLAI